MLDSEFSEIIEKARFGDEQAITALYHEFNPSLLRYLRNQLPSMAEDLSSEVWLDAAKGLDNFSGDEGGFKAWIFTIARRRVIDSRRRMARRRTDPVPTGSFEFYSGLADPAREVEEAISAEEAISRLTKTLSKDQAEVILLRVVAGLSVTQTAEVMQKSEGSIRVLQHRALAKLAKVWR
ncbi:MAG: sigma-70 family RNA polymerase sigma factor [Actinobacteria bacterium]|nr:sigma-70 family RNA polymerase sigma factor [Actinomycetota bacterium]MCL6094329.1 sigma-70 family RNA polymerase sigma factor [Actinomycetota bacterium]